MQFKLIHSSVVYSIALFKLLQVGLPKTKQCDQWRHFLILYRTRLNLLISPQHCFTKASVDQAENEKGSVGLCWHAAGSVWLEPTEVNLTAVFWVTPSVCDRPARAGCLWHFPWYPTDLYLGPVQVLLSTVHPLKAPLTFFHEWLFSCSLSWHYSAMWSFSWSDSLSLWWTCGRWS